MRIKIQFDNYNMYRTHNFEITKFISVEAVENYVIFIDSGMRKPRILSFSISNLNTH